MQFAVYHSFLVAIFVVSGLAYAGGSTPRASVGETSREKAFEAKLAEHGAKARTAWTAAEKKFVFDCDLNQAKLPKIILSSEDHDDPACKEDRCRRIADAAKGICYMGIEGAYCDDAAHAKTLEDAFAKDDPKSSRIFGYDDPFTHGMGLLLRAHGRFEMLVEQKKTDAANGTKVDLLASANQTYLREAWREVRRPFADPSQETIAKVIDANITKSADVAEAAVAGLGKEHPWNRDQGAYRTILESWMRSYVTMAESDRYRLEKMVPPNIRELVEAQLKGSDFRSSLRILAVEWRNQFLARNIARIYCRALREGKLFDVMVGALHSPDLQRLLRVLSGNRIRVEVREARAMPQYLPKFLPPPTEPPRYLPDYIP